MLFLFLCCCVSIMFCWRILFGVFLLAVLTIYFTGMEIFKEAFNNKMFAFPEMKRSDVTRENISSYLNKSSNGTSKQDIFIQHNMTSKLILLWNPVYRSVQALTEYYTKVCPAHKCKVTSDKKLISDADAVLFEADFLHELPKKTKPGQVWIYTDMESPAYRGNELAKWNNVFNWTVSYRRDSDIPFYYGSIFHNENKSNHISQHDIKNKTSRMLWMVSHCGTPSKREEYIKELKQFINVDIIGRCGNNICNRELPCQQKMLNTYKFYFGAENADCRDYITEKAFRTLRYPVLPILRGGYNYSIFLPPLSYVDVHKFNTSKDLANFMKTIDHDSVLSKPYFTWKKYYLSSDAPTKSGSFCLMCERLQNQNKYRRLYKSIHDWWRGNEGNSEYFCNKKQLSIV